MDDPESRLYIPPAVRKLWGALLAPVVAVLVIAGWPDVVKVIIAAVWATPSVAYNGTLAIVENRRLRRRLRAAAAMKHLPPAGATTPERVTRLLETAYLELSAQGTGKEELRFTLFMPNDGRLEQYARFAWDGSMAVSDTAFEFDEGLVGESYTGNTDIVVPDIQALSDLEVVKGLMRHKKRDIRSVLVKAITNDEGQCVAVLSVDSTTRNFFDPHLRSLDCIAEVAASIEELLRC